jgi:CRISPR system Cascade subunit CasE
VKTLSGRGPQGNRKKNGSHYAITRIKELRPWFAAKAEQNGFKVLDKPEFEIAPPVFHRFSKKGDDGLLVGVEFKGALEVIDKKMFLKAAFEGIGRARGLGFGMLILKPIF